MASALQPGICNRPLLARAPRSRPWSKISDIVAFLSNPISGWHGSRRPTSDTPLAGNIGRARQGAAKGGNYTPRSTGSNSGRTKAADGLRRSRIPSLPGLKLPWSRPLFLGFPVGIRWLDFLGSPVAFLCAGQVFALWLFLESNLRPVDNEATCIESQEYPAWTISFQGDR